MKAVVKIDEETLHKISDLTIKLFPSDHAVVSLCRLQSSETAWLSVHTEGHMVGLRAPASPILPLEDLKSGGVEDHGKAKKGKKDKGHKDDDHHQPEAPAHAKAAPVPALAEELPEGAAEFTAHFVTDFEGEAVRSTHAV